MTTLPPIRSLALRQRFEAIAARGRTLDLTRGKPSDEQVALVQTMQSLPVATPSNMNYGAIEGLRDARVLFGELVGAPWEQTFVSGNASLSVMRNLVAEALARPLPDDTMFTWRTAPEPPGRKPAMLCPSPGYDRQHAICKHYGIDMIPVPMKENGPDMDVVLRHVKRPEVVGMWCVPIYSNPSGITYSPEMCRRLAWMKATEGFRIFWDLAYVVHHLVDSGGDTLPDMLELCREAKHPDRVFVIASTSKITCPDAGLGILASSPANMEWYRKCVVVDTIGQHKQNQLRHVGFLGNLEGIHRHMRKHRNILRPKFDLVQEVLRRELGNTGLAMWNEPRGGYFVGLTLNGVSARKVEARAAQGGLKLTPAGATDPLGKDDTFLRIAPTYGSLEELGPALELLALSVLIEAEN